MSGWRNFKWAILSIALLVVCTHLHAQDTAMNCDMVQSMTFDENEISGSWYEIARYPAPQETYECVQVNFTAEANDVLDISTTYSNSPNYPWVNQTMTASITGENVNGYNVSYMNGPIETPSAIFKLIYTDYDNYTLICGYQNVSDLSTYFGVLLMRERMPSSDEVDAIIDQASVNYAQFPNNSMTPIVQNEYCTASAARSYATIIVTIVALLTALACLI